MELHLTIDDQIMRTLKTRMKTENPIDIVREALNLLDWATGETSDGRVILSIGEDGSNPKRIVTPGLKACS
jgi:hypothetical protein